MKRFFLFITIFLVAVLVLVSAWMRLSRENRAVAVKKEAVKVKEARSSQVVKRPVVVKEPQAVKSVPAPIAAKKPESKGDASPRVAIVLDDFGYSERNFAALGAMKVPLTLAVLPDTPQVKKVCAFAKKNGLEMIVHLPMEPENSSVGLEKNTILVGMDRDRVKEIVLHAINAVPGAIGLSNHMGSKATADAETMKTVCAELKKKKLIFLDSLTSESSVAANVAKECGVPCVSRDIFIDNKLDKASIISEIEKAAEIARVNGYSVAIGHDKSVTVETLAEIAPRMREEGIKFVTLSEVVRKK